MYLFTNVILTIIAFSFYHVLWHALTKYMKYKTKYLEHVIKNNFSRISYRNFEVEIGGGHGLIGRSIFSQLADHGEQLYNQWDVQKNVTYMTYSNTTLLYHKKYIVTDTKFIVQESYTLQSMYLYLLTCINRVHSLE